MPLLEINLSRYISASIRLDETTAEQVDQYAAFVHASADDVVTKALNYVFSKDRDFQDFLKTTHAREVAPTLRVRRGLTKDAKHEADHPAKKLGTGGGVHGFCAGGEGVIHPAYSCRSKNGASHRMNLDTPPLEGSCLVPSEPNGFPARTKNLPGSGNLLVSSLRRRNEGLRCH
jgi:hypothetical protein